MYEKLAGMTGTAVTEADEFFDIYKLEVLEVPTNMPLFRLDDPRRGLSHRQGEIPLDHHPDRGMQGARPAGVVGTTSIEKSEQLAEMLRERGWEAHDFTDPNAFA